MASFEKLVIQLRQKKNETTNLRKKTEQDLKDTLATERRSSLGLTSVDKKIDSERKDVFDVSAVLMQKNSQLESIERLVTIAEERLSGEKESIEQIKQEIEFSENPEEKQNAEFRLRSLNDHVKELLFEIKSRQKTGKKISDDIADLSNIKSHITSKIQKQSKSKPLLRETMSTSHKVAQKFEKELERLTKTEESAKNALERVSTKLKEILVKRRKAAKKTPARKTVTKKTPARKKRLQQEKL